MSRCRSFVVLATLALVVVGCASGDDGAGGTIPPVTPVPTIGGVGVVPAKPSAIREPVVVVRPPVNVDGTEATLIGDLAEGNRILMIGDSILASTSSRYGNQMCETVVPLGWQVAVEAEPSRFIDFGNRVLDRVLQDDAAAEDDWNAAVVFLGSNYRGDAEAYEAELVEILDRLAPRPVLLLTVTEYRPNYVEVNEVVNRLGAERDNVTVLDWKSISEGPGILSSDRLHPTDTGRRVLTESVAAALGSVDGEGDCLRSNFRDDSAVGGNSSTVLGRRSTGSRSSGSTSVTTTTVRSPTVTTTTATATDGGGDGDGNGGASTTSPPAGSSTVPASTAAPTTAPTTPPTPPPPTQPTPAPAPPGP